MRPAHVHFMISAPGCATLTTHVFRAGDPHLGADAVFGEKERLVRAFTRHEPGPGPDGQWLDHVHHTMSYDFVLDVAGEAADLLSAAGKRRAEHKQTIDSVAAALILEWYLEERDKKERDKGQEGKAEAEDAAIPFSHSYAPTDKAIEDEAADNANIR